MKKGFLLIALFIYQVSFAQQVSLPLNSSNLLKVNVIKDGIHRLTKADFDAAGAPTGAIDPRTIKVIHKGQEIPVYFAGEDNGVFDPDDFMDFYGERNYGGLTNFYNFVGSSFQLAYQKYEFFNLYSDTNVYWITWGGVNGLRFNQAPIHSTINYENKFVYHELHIEKEMFYSLGEHLAPNDDRQFLNDMLKGEGWYWRRLQFNNVLDENVYIRHMYTDENIPVTLNLNGYPVNQNTLITNEHRVAALINNVPIDTFYSNNMNLMNSKIFFSNSRLNNNANNFFRFRYRPPNEFTAGVMNIDYFKVIYPRRFLLDSNQFSFTSDLVDSNSRIYRIAGFNSSNELNIYDVKNNYRIVNYTQNGDTLIFTGKGNGKFEIFNKPITQKPLRVTQRVLPDLTSSANGVDYLIIFNKAFTDQAEQLRLHRESTDGFRALKVEIEDIYDVFNYGVEDPVAVRNFMNYVYNNWTLPKVKYLCLFGRGSLDPKKNLASSVYNINFVPVWGNPTTDGYFVNFTPGTFSYIHQIAVGRLPAYTVKEAQLLVDKIIFQDTRQLEEWDKKYVLITAGFSKEHQNQFSAYSDTFINNYVSPAPLSNEAVRIYRNDSIGFASFNYADSIVNSINGGAAVINYFGHAATSHWDNGLENPSVVFNNDKPGVVFSLTCYTGKNAEPNERSFGEIFALLPDNRGTIGFIGSSGYAFITGGSYLNGFFFRSISNDSLRAIGEILKRTVQYMIIDTVTFQSSHMINSFNLIGDPALKLKQPLYPVFRISQNDFELSDDYPSLNEIFSVSIYPRNLGGHADSCKFRYTLIRNGINYVQSDTIVYGLGFRNTISRNVMLDSLGRYEMRVEIDPDNWFPGIDPVDNVIEFDIPLRNISYTPLKPLDNEIQRSANVEFVGLNPVVNPENDVKVILQIDTTDKFNSSMKQIFFQDGVDATSTRFSTILPIADSNIIYFWRMASIVNNDSSGWSEIRRFRYNPNILPILDLDYVKSGMPSEQKEIGERNFNGDSAVTIYKSKQRQFSNKELKGLSYVPESEGFELTNFTGKIFLSAFGENYWDASYFTSNNEEFYLTDSIKYRGYNFAKLRKVDGKILEVKNFKLTNAQLSSDSIVNYLNTFKDSHILLIIKGYPQTNNFLQQNARAKIREFGSLYVDSLISNWDRWGFISVPSGGGKYDTREGYRRHIPNTWTPVEIEMNLEQKYIQGSISNIFGPAENWGYLSWDQSVKNNEKITFDVYGINNEGEEIKLVNANSNHTGVNLSRIDTYLYPKLRLVCNVQADSAALFTSPVFKGMRMVYQPAAEFCINTYKWVSGDSAFQHLDFSTEVTLEVVNLGYSDYYGTVYNWRTEIGGESILVNSDTVNHILFKDSIYAINTKFKVYDYEQGQLITDKLPLTLEVVPLSGQREFYTYNNKLFKTIFIKSDIIQEQLTVTVDGGQIRGGEKVNQNPEIKASLKNVNRLDIADTSIMSVFVNGRYIPYYSAAVNERINNFEKDADNTFTLMLQPFLEAGENRLSFVFSLGSSSSFDTIGYDVFVDNEFRVVNIYNYPNPMRDGTKFMFDVNGINSHSKGYIRIYTVSGRRIKTIEIRNLNNGTNYIEWDGRDDDGDLIANGTYMYKLSIESDIKLDLPVQKLVILK